MSSQSVEIPMDHKLPDNFSVISHTKFPLS
jgi:hypothetical protein